jgi:hypothetical protein
VNEYVARRATWRAYTQLCWVEEAASAIVGSGNLLDGGQSVRAQALRTFRKLGRAGLRRASDTSSNGDWRVD